MKILKWYNNIYSSTELYTLKLQIIIVVIFILKLLKFSHFIYKTTKSTKKSIATITITFSIESWISLTSALLGKLLKIEIHP